VVPHSAVDAYARLVESLGCTVTDRQVEIATTRDENEAAENALRALAVDPNRPLVGLSTGGAYGAAKRWPDHHFGMLAQQLVDRLGVQVLVVCGPAEREAADQIAQLADRPLVVSLSGQPLSLGLTKGCLNRCSLVVATDSGPRHLAAGLGVPTIGLFGPTDPRWSHNYSRWNVELLHAVPCGPCGRRSCPLGHHACMNDLQPQDVLQAVENLWRQIPIRQAA
jgi:heptosyltransferase-2